MDHTGLGADQWRHRGQRGVQRTGHGARAGSTARIAQGAALAGRQPPTIGVRQRRAGTTAAQIQADEESGQWSVSSGQYVLSLVSNGTLFRVVISLTTDHRPLTTDRTPSVVIVGGGFGGLYAARSLARLPVRVLLIDRLNYHLFQPLLYQVATAALSPGDIAEPLRAILRKQRNVEVLLGDVSRIDPVARTVRLEDGDEFSYDFMVLATGARHSYFGHPEWELWAPGLKSLADAIELRRRIFLAFELAERERDPVKRRALLTFVVVGGGPTGVELAGAIAEIARHTVSQDFRRFDPRQAHVVLLEGGERVLAPYPADLSARAQRALDHLGVDVRTGSVATEITADRVCVGEDTISTHTTLWAAGVSASPLGRQLGVEVDRSGRVPVLPDLSVPGHPELFVVGDLAVFTQPNGKVLPGIAPVAIQQGAAAAANIGRVARGQPTQEFHYHDRGTMATIGRAAAVAEIHRLHLSGLLAWLAWLVVHIFFLIGFENRMLVLLQWAWSYLSHERGARLITGGWHPGTPHATD
jgi:NADH:ubiquinone reductase (H+-translocating)